MEYREDIWESQIYQSSFFDKEISELKFSQSLFASIYLNNASSIDNLFIFSNFISFNIDIIFELFNEFSIFSSYLIFLKEDFH